MTQSPDEYRKASRARWGASAAGWAKRRATFDAAAMPVTAAMIDAVAPQPGHALLELAAGIGDVGFLALELAQPGGSLICSDFSPEMLSAAQARAAELGLDASTADVRFKQVDAESIDLDAGTLDAVVCRWGYMLMADPGAALRETRRILKPGGRVALAAWTGPEENPWSALPGGELETRGLKEAPAPGAPGQFTWADPSRIEEALGEAGFVDDVEVARVPFTWSAWWAAQRDLSSPFAETLDGLDPETLEAVRSATRAAAAPFGSGEEGALALPAATWVASATA